MWDHNDEGKEEHTSLKGGVQKYTKENAIPYSNYTNICISATTKTNNSSEKTCISGTVQTKEDGKIIKYFFFNFILLMYF